MTVPHRIVPSILRRLVLLGLLALIASCTATHDTRHTTQASARQTRDSVGGGKKDKRSVKVMAMPHTAFADKDPVKFTATVHNKQGEPAAGKEVAFKLHNSSYPSTGPTGSDGKTTAKTWHPTVNDAGSNTIKASAIGKSDTDKVTVVTGDIKLEADPRILAWKDDSSTKLTATVRDGQYDGEITFCEDTYGKLAAPNASSGKATYNYKFPLAGKYEFTASYSRKTSNTATVLAVAGYFRHSEGTQKLLWYRKGQARNMTVAITPKEAVDHVSFRFTGTDAGQFSVTKQSVQQNMVSLSVKGTAAGHHTAPLQVVLDADDGEKVLDSRQVEQVTILDPAADTVVNGHSISTAFRTQPSNVSISHELTVTPTMKGTIGGNASAPTFVPNGTDAVFPNNKPTTTATIAGTVTVGELSVNVSHQVTIKNSPPTVAVKMQVASPHWNSNTIDTKAIIEIT